MTHECLVCSAPEEVETLYAIGERFDKLVCLCKPCGEQMKKVLTTLLEVVS